MKHYPKHSWISPQITLRESPIECKGLFAKSLIKQGEVIEIFGELLLQKKKRKVK